MFVSAVYPPVSPIFQKIDVCVRDLKNFHVGIRVYDFKKKIISLIAGDKPMELDHHMYNVCMYFVNVG